MALTKIPRGLLDTGIADSSDATAITIDSSENVTFAGNILKTGSLTVDVSGTLILDSDDGDLQLKDGGTQFASLYKSSNDFIVRSMISDGDFKIQGNDGGSTINALTIDMSDAGAATFNNTVTIPKLLTLNNPASVQAKFNPNNNSFAAVAEFYNGTSSSNPFIVGQGYATGTDNISYVWNRANADLLFGTNNTEKMRITNSTHNHVVIGSSSVTDVTAQWATGAVLDIHDSGSSNTGNVILSNDLTTNNGGIGSLVFANRNNSNAGGDTNTVVSAISASLATSDSNSGDDSGGYLRFLTKPEAGSLSERMRITSAGDTTFTGASSTARIASHSYGMSFETTTSDGSDNSSVSLDGGGGAGSTSRGAFFGCYGNEASTHGGSIVAQLGASGDYKFYGGSGGDKIFHLNGTGAAGLELGASRFVVGGAYNTGSLYNTGTVSAIGIYGANAYSSCGAHIETATDADSGWAPFYVNKFDWASGDDARWMSFAVNGYNTDYGTINYDGTNFAIVNYSDYRLKENIVDYSGGLAKLEELKVRTFNKKEGVSKHITQQGFIAHEAATANIPGFIGGEKDAMKVDETGETVPAYQTVNKEALIPYLVSAIQELSAKVKELESK